MPSKTTIKGHLDLPFSPSHYCNELEGTGATVYEEIP